MQSRSLHVLHYLMFDKHAFLLPQLDLKQVEKELEDREEQLEVSKAVSPVKVSWFTFLQS